MAVLVSQPAGILADLDGTLAPIVGDPGAVRVPDATRDSLVALARRLAVVGIVSGRAALDVRRILEGAELLVIGNHGAEWLQPLGERPRVPEALRGATERLAALLRVVPAEAGVSVEHKGLSATVHYRNAPNPADAHQRILAALGPAAGDDVELRDGRMSVELRPRGLGDKGGALREVVDRNRLRGLLVLGDDTTDLDMFRAATELRRAGTLDALVIAVGGGGGEVPPEVAAAADAVLPDPAAVGTLLRDLARE